MGILKKNNNDNYDQIINMQKKSLAQDKRTLSLANKRLKTIKKRKRKATFHHILNKVAAKPITRKQGMEMMFGTKDFRDVYNRKG